MKKYNRTVFSGACLALAMVAAPLAAHAEGPSINVRTDLRAQVIGEDNADLGVLSNEPTDSEALEAKVKVDGNVTDNISFLVEFRGVKNYGSGGSVDTDTGEAAGRKDFLELRQYWVQVDNLFGDYSPFAVRAGRQRIKEDRGLWWNRDLDAVSLMYDATLFDAQLTVGQNLAEYRTSDDSFLQDDQDILRVLGETSWQWRYGQFLESRFAYQNDYSGMESAGIIIPSDDRDESDADLFWFGVRAQGDLGGLQPKLEPTRVNYRVDVMGVTGHDEVQSSTSGPGSNRTVTGVSDKDVLGWALDAEVNVPVPVSVASQEPVFILGYAFGSGDDDSTDGTDHAFRQTGLDGNTSRPGTASGSIHNYGSVLRPDLSNIHVMTAGVVVPVSQASDVTGLYHYYRLDEKATSLSTSGIDASLNGTDKGLGQGLDVMFNSNLTKEFGLPDQTVERVDFKATLGAFRGGNAYGAGDGETAVRGQVELRFRF
ncbi:MAG: alginate export family protein [Alphaproteobacteria bacterium]|nr:alginate export family protein [Alphaproteobacteria bacterium]